MNSDRMTVLPGPLEHNEINDLECQPGVTAHTDSKGRVGEVSTLLRPFVRESNKIEGILREPTIGEVLAHATLLEFPVLTVAAIEAFVSVIAPNKPLRRRVGWEVRVGNHIAPPGGPEIEVTLAKILDAANRPDDPYIVHQLYETLHPFCDGNGRSGRAIWLWQFKRFGSLDYALELGFLHHWYYQSLSHSQVRL